MIHRPSGALRGLSAFLVLTVAVGTSGCGTLISGTTQKVKVATNPAGSTVQVFQWNGARIGDSVVSPNTAVVPRPKGKEKSRLVVASMPGYCPRYWLTTSQPSGGAWTYLWLAFWPAVGPLLILVTNALVDNATGGCCAMAPDVYDVALQPEVSCPGPPSE